jgi:inhibitor of cysteine peptidase
MKSSLLILLILCAAAFQLRAQEKSYTASDTSISASVGEVFSIKVASNRTTGYAWSVSEISDSGQVAILGSEYIAPEEGRVGEGGDDVWKFKAVGKGTVKLIWNYTRPWETEAPAKTVTFTVTVN